MSTSPICSSCDGEERRSKPRPLKQASPYCCPCHHWARDSEAAALQPAMVASNGGSSRAQGCRCPSRPRPWPPDEWSHLQWSCACPANQSRQSRSEDMAPAHAPRELTLARAQLSPWPAHLRAARPHLAPPTCHPSSGLDAASVSWPANAFPVECSSGGAVWQSTVPNSRATGKAQAKQGQGSAQALSFAGARLWLRLAGRRNRVSSICQARRRRLARKHAFIFPTNGTPLAALLAHRRCAWLRLGRRMRSRGGGHRCFSQRQLEQERNQRLAIGGIRLFAFGAVEPRPVVAVVLQCPRADVQRREDGKGDGRQRETAGQCIACPLDDLAEEVGAADEIEHSTLRVGGNRGGKGPHLR